MEEENEYYNLNFAAPGKSLYDMNICNIAKKRQLDEHNDIRSAQLLLKPSSRRSPGGRPAFIYTDTQTN